MTEIEEKILNSLKTAGVAYEVFEHEPVYTCRKMAKFLKTGESRIAKSMVVKKSSGGYALIVLPGNLKIDFEHLASATKSRWPHGTRWRASWGVHRGASTH